MSRFMPETLTHSGAPGGVCRVNQVEPPNTDPLLIAGKRENTTTQKDPNAPLKSGLPQQMIKRTTSLLHWVQCRTRISLVYVQCHLKS